MDRMATAVGVMEAVRMRNPWCSHMGVPECQRISVYSVSETRDGQMSPSLGRIERVVRNEFPSDSL